jgi:hypothetical protein
MHMCCCKSADLYLDFGLVHDDDLASLVVMAIVWVPGEEDEGIAAHLGSRGSTQCSQDGFEKHPQLQRETF